MESLNRFLESPRRDNVERKAHWMKPESGFQEKGTLERRLFREIICVTASHFS